MSNVIRLAGNFFTYLFVRAGNPLSRIIIYISNDPILVLGSVFLLIGFAVSILSRILHS